MAAIGLLAKLAGGNYSAVGGSVRGTRHVFRDGRYWLQFEQHRYSVLCWPSESSSMTPLSLLKMSNAGWLAGCRRRGSHLQGDGSHLADHRDYGTVLSGVHTVRVHYGDDGAILPPVRHHHRGFHGDLDDQLADVQPGILRSPRPHSAKPDWIRGLRFSLGGSSGCSTGFPESEPTSTRG